jgi:predicted ATPase
LEFGRFKFIPDRRLLLHGGRPTHLPSRARELLFVLVERAGELIKKRELLARIWRGRVVEEGALRVHVATLRKILGDGTGELRYIESVHGQGYRFVAPVTSQSASVPPTRSRIVGRAMELRKLTESVSTKRIVTISGPGGMGKTTLAMGAMEGLRDRFQEIGWVDLGSNGEPASMLTTIGASLGCSPTLPDTLARIVARLKGRTALLVLDSSEHLIDAVAEVAETLLRLLPELHVLATSREALRIRGEWVLRLGSLDLSAVTLFTQLAAESLGTFELRDADVPIVVDICRKLDGIPLAIELAATRVGLFGLTGLATRLDECLKLLTGGRRTNSPRHQTLRASMDWSYRALSEIERRAFRRLAVFTGHFDVEAASAVLADDAIAASDVIDILTRLEAKSLIMADPLVPNGALHLLQTWRAYALEKLADSGESFAIMRRHVQLCGSGAWPAVLPL